MVAAGRMPVKQAFGYIASQVVGGIVGALILVIILSGNRGEHQRSRLQTDGGPAISANSASVRLS